VGARLYNERSVQKVPRAGISLDAGGGVLVECVSILRDTGATTALLDCSSWDYAVSDAVAHLISAQFKIEALVGHPQEPVGVAMSLELASQAVWAALVSLDAYSSSLGSPKSTNDCSPAQRSSGGTLTDLCGSGEIQGQLVDRAVS
jgi:hypothetical protein